LAAWSFCFVVSAQTEKWWGTQSATGAKARVILGLTRRCMHSWCAIQKSELVTALVAQPADDCGYVVFLEEADGGYAGCAGLQAGVGVLQGYSSQGQDWDFCVAGLG